MLHIYLNDEIKRIESTQSLQDVLIQYQTVEQHVAIAVNHQLVPRCHHPSTFLNAGDRVDVIVPMQGG